jgi:hypothetical protein
MDEGVGRNLGLERIQNFIGLPEAQGLERRSDAPPACPPEGQAIPFQWLSVFPISSAARATGARAGGPTPRPPLRHSSITLQRPKARDFGFDPMNKGIRIPMDDLHNALGLGPPR